MAGRLSENGRGCKYSEPQDVKAPYMSGFLATTSVTHSCIDCSVKGWSNGKAGPARLIGRSPLGGYGYFFGHNVATRYQRADSA